MSVRIKINLQLVGLLAISCARFGLALDKKELTLAGQHQVLGGVLEEGCIDILGSSKKKKKKQEYWVRKWKNLSTYQSCFPRQS